MSQFKQWRKANKLTQAQAAERIGASKSTWGRLESGQEVAAAYLMAAKQVIGESEQDKPAEVEVIVLPAEVDQPQAQTDVPAVFSRDQIRTESINGAVWFALTDICSAVDYSNPSAAAKLMREDDLTVREIIDSLGRKQSLLFVSESGLYQFLLRCRLPKAEAFSRWVTAEVLPTLRQTGSYNTQPASVGITDLARLVGLRTEQLEQQIKEQSQRIEEVKETATQAAIEAAKAEFLSLQSQAEAKAAEVGRKRVLIRKSLEILADHIYVKSQKTETREESRSLKASIFRSLWGAVHLATFASKFDDVRTAEQADQALACLARIAKEHGLILPAITAEEAI